MNMGAVVGTLLLIPAVLSFGVDRVTARKNNDGISSKAQIAEDQRKARRERRGFFMSSAAESPCVCSASSAVLIMGAFTKVLPL
jgi:iron(III) transport system permease protein